MNQRTISRNEVPPDAYLLMSRWQKEQEQALRHHFYEIIDENQKMEFINGQIRFHSPIKKVYNAVTGRIFIFLSLYADANQLGWVGIEKILVSLTRNDYEPDVCFWRKEIADTFADDQMHFPAPDLAVEVLSPKTAKIDRTIKFTDYEAHGVAEYWLVEPTKKTVEQFVLINGVFHLRFQGGEGLLKSEVVKGFQLPVEAFFSTVPALTILRAFMH